MVPASQADSDVEQLPKPEVALPDPDSSQPDTMRSINFQSYLDNVMKRSEDRNAKLGSKIGQRGTREEIVLPFRFVNPASAVDPADPEGTQSSEAA